MEASVIHDRPGDISKLESKVVLALSRLQKTRYPSRQGRSGGVASKQVANYLAHNYCYLDGDIESQVMTALLSCVKTGLICALNNGKFLLLNPNSKNMASICVTRTCHGPECTCLNLINSIRKKTHKTCCSYKVDGSKLKVKADKNSDRVRQQRLKSVAKKSTKRTKTKIKRQTIRRSRRTSIKCLQKAEKALTERKGAAPPVPAAKADEKIEKCKFCLEKHPHPDSSGKRVCQRCHPPGTRRR